MENLHTNTCESIVNFKVDHYKNQKILDRVRIADKYIVLTTREGARGLDICGREVAHVVIAFSPDSVSECL
jgi:hypothetical protein